MSNRYRVKVTVFDEHIKTSTFLIMLDHQVTQIVGKSAYSLYDLFVDNQDKIPHELYNMVKKQWLFRLPKHQYNTFTDVPKIVSRISDDPTLINVFNDTVASYSVSILIKITFNSDVSKIVSQISDVLESIVVAIPLPKARDKKASSDSLSREGGVRDAGFKHKKKGVNKAAKSKQGFRFSKPKNNYIYRPVSKLITTKENTSKPNTNAPSVSKKDVNGDAIQPNVSPKVIMNDSYGSTDENRYFKDDIDLGQLKSNIECNTPKSR
ncbi:ATPase, F1/V1/A1 complex, alpha/beta subunit [Tanacetum coccineum]